MPKPKNKKEEIIQDIGNYKALEVVANSDGGELLIQSLNKDIVNSIEWLVSNFKEATHNELVSHIAIIKSNMGILRTLKNAKTNVELAEEALKQELETPEL